MTARLSEDEIIATCFAPLAGPGGLRLLDDAALISPPEGADLVLTTDALVAGVHFFADDPPEAIAAKALRVNLSDLAAKGADPAGFLLTLALPPDWRSDWLADFARGLGEDAGRYACPLLGGDTVRTPGPLSLSITAFGTVPRGSMVKRTGVRPDDVIYVSGTIGDAALGLQLRLGDAAWGGALPEEHCQFLRDRYLLPQPRLALRQVLRDHAHAGMDVSDGLVGDLTKMLRVSGVSAEIELARVPLSAAGAAARHIAASLFDTAVTGGDDYEVLLSVAPDGCRAFEAAAAAAGVPVTMIGAAGQGAGPVAFRGADGQPRMFAKGSFSHF
jgi:thiamine-monophosphate kinase